MKPPRRPIEDFRRATARRLRKRATEAEMKLWRHLRRLPAVGSHFRRQVPIGPYVADFACMAARVVIEVDGSQHGEPPGAVSDQERTMWLESQGYRVLRFWNNDVIRYPNGVMEAIYAAVYGSPIAEPEVLK